MKRKLVLSKEQIRILSSDALKLVAGGAAPDDTDTDLCSIAVCRTDNGCLTNPCTGTWDSVTAC